tara:strand:+ start:329 stop:664 length:336 start_codon:yes stop_codon:yes gene_type:complete
MGRRNSGQIKTNAEPALLHGRLQAQPGKLENLFDLVRQIRELDDAVSAWLGDSEQQSVRVANLRAETLVVFSDNAAATTRLRYQREDLLEHLRQHHGFDVYRLEIKVKPRR